VMRTAKYLKESQFQKLIVRLSEFYGWSIYHIKNPHGQLISKTSVGFPDLILINDTGKMIAWELKISPNLPTPEQSKWLKRLNKSKNMLDVSVIYYDYKYPEHLDDLHPESRIDPGYYESHNLISQIRYGLDYNGVWGGDRIFTHIRYCLKYEIGIEECIERVPKYLNTNIISDTNLLYNEWKAPYLSWMDEDNTTEKDGKVYTKICEVK